MNMDKLQELQTQLRNVQETHPNFVALWSTYIRLKEKNLQKSVEQVQSILINIEQQHIPDIPREAIMLLYCMRQTNQL